MKTNLKRLTPELIDLMHGTVSDIKTACQHVAEARAKWPADEITKKYITDKHSFINSQVIFLYECMEQASMSHYTRAFIWAELAAYLRDTHPNKLAA